MSKTIFIFPKFFEKVSDIALTKASPEFITTLAMTDRDMPKPSIKMCIRDRHKGADICTDPTHCKAWISEEKRRELWGAEKADEYWNKISDAVESTAGVLITYNKEPVSYTHLQKFIPL